MIIQPGPQWKELISISIYFPPRLWHNVEIVTVAEESFMRMPRSSGVLLHPTALPGPHGIGALGAEARAFVDFLAGAGQSVWQTLPLGPTGYGDSPYNALSAFAGNPALIDLQQLADQPRC